MDCDLLLWAPNKPFSCKLFPPGCYIRTPEEIKTSKFKGQGQRRTVFITALCLPHQQVCLPVTPFLYSWIPFASFPLSRLQNSRWKVPHCLDRLTLHKSNRRTLITVLFSTLGATFTKGSCPQPTLWFLLQRQSGGVFTRPLFPTEGPALGVFPSAPRGHHSWTLGLGLRLPQGDCLIKILLASSNNRGMLNKTPRVRRGPCLLERKTANRKGIPLR